MMSDPMLRVERLVVETPLAIGLLPKNDETAIQREQEETTPPPSQGILEAKKNEIENEYISQSYAFPLRNL